jgi:hypothetical protein
VTHHATSRFWRCYQELPKEIRDLADRKYALLKTDPAHVSLRFKKTASLWSVRVGLHYRALATEVDGDLVWFWLGSHAEYDKLVGRKPSEKSRQAASRTRKRPTTRSQARRG